MGLCQEAGVDKCKFGVGSTVLSLCRTLATMFRSKMLVRDECVLLKCCMSTIQHRLPRAGLVQNVAGYEHFTALDGVQASKLYHPLATMDDQQLRETRRLLLLSLQAITYTFPKYIKDARFSSAASSPSEEGDHMNEDSMLGPLVRQSLDSAQVQEEQSNSILERMPRNDNPIGKVTNCKSETSIGRQFMQAIQQNKVEHAKFIFNEAAAAKTKLPRKGILNLAFLVVKDDPALALSFLKQMERQEQTLSKGELALYTRLCGSVGKFTPGNHNRRYVTDFVENLLDQIKSLEQRTQQILLPGLITGLLTQPYHAVGTYAGTIYRYMVNNDFRLQPYLLRKWLMYSKYNRQDDLPFHDIMHKLTTLQSSVHPLILIQAINNMFPFTDTHQMCVALRALQVFHQWNNLAEHPNLTRNEEFQIDLDSLECISAAAAKYGDVELMIIIWEVLQQCQYRPTEAIYENTILSFASRGADLRAAFGAINAMKGDGHDVSRSLYRSFTRALRAGVNAENGMRILESSEDLISLETLNAMMSFYAYRGDVTNVFHILKTMRSRNIKPDIHSYSFAMEVLGKHILALTSNATPYQLQVAWDHATNILDEMEKDDVLISRDLLRNYIELLCVTGESNLADSVVDDMIRDSPDLVCSKTLYTLIKVNVDNRDFDRARTLARQIRDDIPTIWNMISRQEQRHHRTR